MRSFLLTVDSGSMSEAARRLDITPAAVAQQIRALEKELEVQLVERAGRTVRPTQAGHMLAANARAIVASVDNLKFMVNISPLAGELRLGAINTALLSFLPRVLNSLRSECPSLHVSIRSGHSSELIGCLQNNELDAVICIEPNFAFPKSMLWHVFRQEPLVLLTSARTKEDDPETLLRENPLIRYDRNLAGGKQAERFLVNLNVHPTEVVELSSILAIALMVEAGLGVSVVPDIDSKLINSLEIRKRPLRDESHRRVIGILTHRHSIKSDVISRLVRCYEALSDA
ncbi:LysR family transcriptional regulator [Orrella marina]|uniref:LysR family transcriptional regulator n=1 Tax=Orrella marina TaxID=2163011 RepID=UPI001D131C41|nr:LysR family transcriptional regulator [Orrella marina]